MSKLESLIQKEIIEYLKANNWLVTRNHTQGIKYTRGVGTNPNRGIPDLGIVKEGRLTYIEVKTEKGKLSEDQKKWIKNAERYGVKTIVACSVEDVIKGLSKTPKAEN